MKPSPGPHPTIVRLRRRHKCGIPARLDVLTHAQRRRLIRWLTQDKITYDAARQRCLKLFRVQTSSAALSTFFHTHCRAHAVAGRPVEASLATIYRMLREIHAAILKLQQSVRLIVKNQKAAR